MTKFKAFFLIIMLELLISCVNKLKPKEMEVNITDKTIYMLNYNTNCNFTLFLNDFMLHNTDHISGQEGGLIDLNPFMVNGSTQTIKIFISGKDGQPLSENELKNQSFQLIEAKVPLAESPFDILSQAAFNAKVGNRQFAEINFTAKINYNIDEISLDHAQDLTKIDSENLLNQVLNFYNKYGEIINTGNMELYKNIFSHAHRREFLSMYYSESETEHMINKLSDRILKSRGHLQPLENYSLFIHPNKKIVELKTKDGKSPLYSKSNGVIRRFGLYLFKPNNSVAFQVY